MFHHMCNIKLCGYLPQSQGLRYVSMFLRAHVQLSHIYLVSTFDVTHTILYQALSLPSGIKSLGTNCLLHNKTTVGLS